ncbi:hypothetical protein [Paraburkholderia tropica]|uniref:hypothetical protein n=1 Tax=Paraburkholderia tropica TaxID=92647 RepID=UPI0007EC6C02|nr:hypothetical protein [Paraburkholderia tropica]OBR52361.1 hypothetical protein A6456_10705 [Paraburkholderia tropica]
MTEDEALEIGRQVVQSAKQEVGDDRSALLAVIEKRAESDPEVMEAFAVAGKAILESTQETKH